jgi:glycine dehydrogenase
MSALKFVGRHIGPRESDILEMISKIGIKSLDELIDKIVPEDIRLKKPIDVPAGISEYEYINRLKKIASKNKIFKTYIGTGYYSAIFPAVIQRNILENPNWYTSYTPYQAEISQGRLEALLNFQTVIVELTGMEVANASLLDEATAVAEAMVMLYNARSRQQVNENVSNFFVDEDIFPQTLAVLETRSEPLGIKIIKGSYLEIDFSKGFFGALIQYPSGSGEIRDYSTFVTKAHEAGCNVAVAADLLSLALLTPPGEWNADVVIGSVQRFGLPLGYGGPHAAFFATREAFKRLMPGRIIGISKDVKGRQALRMALQTREQHIRREKATSNICTAQALLAIMAGMYAIYHGPEGLRSIASHCHYMAGFVAKQLKELGYTEINKNFFDTLKIQLPPSVKQSEIKRVALQNEINFRYFENGNIGISIDETTNIEDIVKLINVFATLQKKENRNSIAIPEKIYYTNNFVRKTDFLKSFVFSKYRSETEMMRYIKKLEKKDISLADSMISLGSCTMKLNAAIEMLALSWPEFGAIHPFVPVDQAAGYHQLFNELGKMLIEITGFKAVSFQPNSGAAGEYAGLIVIRKYHESRNEKHRNIILIPASAHGTNPASAVAAGMDVVVIKCNEKGNIDINDLKEKAAENADNLAGFMVTYPSTHGVFEHNIKEMTSIIHQYGGMVYMDGANMNAQVGLTNPATIGADVCHLNLHKTFAIPHGGGGPGAGPICVAEHLVKFLPGHPVIADKGASAGNTVAAAPWGSASILTISHAYCYLLGAEGLTTATKIAILNANYIAASLKEKFGVLYTGETGFVAHEMILECRQFKKSADISELDIAKRLMDYGFHAPTLSFPVHGTLMVEPTESESKEELDRFIESMLSIYTEIQEVIQNNNKDNVLQNAPHCMADVTADNWDHPYSRQKAAFPLTWIVEKKFWPPVSRIDDAFGDRNLICTCLPLHEQ